jgi:transposase-like protein
MAGKREKPEEIVSKLRQVEVLQGQGATIAEAVRQIGVTQQTFYRWRKLYGGMQRSQLVRLKELEKENQRLRRAVSDLTLDKLILTEAAKGNFIRPLSSDQWRKMVSSFASPEMHRACAAGAWRVRAPRLPHTWPAPIDAAQSSTRPC